MQCRRGVDVAIPRIEGGEAPGVGLIITCPQMVKAAVGVVLLAGEEVRVLCGAGNNDQVAEGIVIIAVGDGSTCVGQQARRAETVEVIPIRLTAPRHADKVVGIYVGRDQRVVGCVLRHHLRQAAVGIDQVFDRSCRAAALDPVAVGVVGVGGDPRR